MRTYKFSGSTSGRKMATSPEDWTRIEPFLLGPVSRSEIVTFSFDAANTLVDMDAEQFLPECLEDFAASAPGVPVLLGHDWSAPAGVGRVYQGWVEQRGTVTWLRLSAFFDLRDADSAAFVRKLESGLAGACSVGFICPERSQSGVYSRGRNGERCTLLELSLVWRGAQIQATPTKWMLTAMTKGLDERQARTARKSWSFLIPRA